MRALIDELRAAADARKFDPSAEQLRRLLLLAAEELEQCASEKVSRT